MAASSAWVLRTSQPWLAGRHQAKAYPTTDELVDFGRRICGVSRTQHILQSIADAMQRTLDAAVGDGRVPPALLAKMSTVWQEGMAYAR